MEREQHDTQADIHAGHDMHGWRIQVIFDAAKINAKREQSDSQKPAIHQTLHYERPRSATRELVICELRRPIVQYLPDRVQVKSSIASYANFIWSAPVSGGKPRASLDRVVAFTRNEPQFLYQEFPLDGFVGHCAGPDAPLTLNVGIKSSFYVQAAGSTTPDVGLATSFANASMPSRMNNALSSPTRSKPSHKANGYSNNCGFTCASTPAQALTFFTS